MTLLLDTRLKTSLVPATGSGSASFTRATSKRVKDNEGKLISVKSGAVALGGVRCVQNFCAGASEDLTNAGWTKSGLTATDASTLKCANGTSFQYATNQSTGGITVNGQKWLAHYRLQYVDIQYIQILGGNPPFGTGAAGEYCNFDLINGDYTATNCTVTMTAVSAGVWDISVLLTAVNSNGVLIGKTFLALVDAQDAARAASFTGDGIKTVKVLRYQLEDVTGQADQTMSEYVSMGVESAPYYHGPGADGVKYFNTNKDGTPIEASAQDGALIDPESKTNTMLHCRDFTNAAWVKTNTTATLNQTGIDGLANGCSLLEFTANGATILQTITAAAAAGCAGYDVKRHTGTGAIEITRDNVNWTDITNLINTDTFTTVAIENTSVTNPAVGFRGANGNKIIVDAGRNHLGTALCEPIFTTTASVTRNAEVLTYQTSGNFSDTAGTILATFTPLSPGSWPSGAVVGKAGFGLLISDSNSGVQAADGTNTVNGATGAPAYSSIRIGCRWSGSSLEAFSADPLLSVGTAGSYDGSFNLSTIAINPGAAGYIKDVKVYDASLSDAEIKTAWSLLDSQTFLPAFSNLPIYNAGAIIHVEPDPEPVDPEPTPIFATNFVGVTLNETNPYTAGSLALANFEFTGTDSSTGFVLPPTSPPIDTMNVYTGGQFPLGVQALSSMSGYVPGLFPSSNYAGVSNKVTILNGTETIRGVSQNTLKMTLKAPGAINDFNRQMWFAFRRDTVIDMPQNFTVRYEVKVPAMTWDNLYLNFEGVYSLFDIKDSSDYRYFLTIVKNGAGTVGWKLYADRNAINNYGSAQWTPATPTNSRFFTLYNYTTPVPQEEFFTLEYSRTCPYNKDDATNGRFRVRIRTEADGVTEFTTIFDVSASSIAAHNAINGTNYQNRHRSPTTNAATSYIHRMMHGLYGRFQNVDMPYEIAKFRIFDSFDI